MSEMTIEGCGRFFDMLESMRLLRCVTSFVLIMAAGLLIPSVVEAAQQPPAIPDFTHGDRIPAEQEKLDWVLGSTGLRGWMYAWKLETAAARQILITDVAAMSPAAAQCSVGDVILGVDGVHFQGDPLWPSPDCGGRN
ncbi:MAG: PDZ domain-containing protein [Planctomycetota bacterium]|nr:PDZ domain-containing protein [Planctomycetota bacterium]